MDVRFANVRKRVSVCIYPIQLNADIRNFTREVVLGLRPGSNIKLLLIPFVNALGQHQTNIFDVCVDRYMFWFGFILKSND